MGDGRRTFPGAPGVGEGGVPRNSGSAAQETPGPPSCPPQSSLQAARSLALWDGGQLRGEGHSPPHCPAPAAHETRWLLSGPGVASLGLVPRGPKHGFPVRLDSDPISIRWSCVTFASGLTSLSLLPTAPGPRGDLVTWPRQVFQQKLFAGASGFGLRPATHLVGSESMRTGWGRRGGSVHWASASWLRLRS